MTILVVGATGATGRLLVEQLLSRGKSVKAVVRSPEKLPQAVRNSENLTVIQAAILDLSDAEMVELVRGCTAVASCLGHNLNFKGIYGQPRLLVTDAARRLCQAIKANEPAEPVRYVLMNTTGNRNRDIPEQHSFSEKAVTGLLRLLLPPQRDNEKAADYLRREIGQNDRSIEWVAVRPDSLIDENAVSRYEIHPSPIRSAIFDPGKTSRINVAHFMAELVTGDELWQQWQGQMPVLYNQEAE
ncbi:NAD(P)-dependent oxidoreductase [Candidatus Leptofilum sp.]|uniref:NAD(P)-dependent oxidoreductase n=1 Tax=Candidatus Leptofilum sp. TaxID=3241576 RepID=UPI003B5BE2DB